ncbi:MAG: RNA polymerase sigma factor [Ktedonobacteraceae bacterium]
MTHRKKILLPSTKRIVIFIVVLLLSTAEILSPEQSGSASTESSLTDEETLLEEVRKARAGDKEAFTSLYQRHYPQIYKHLYRMVGNPEDASELAAEAFLKAWCVLSDLHNETRFRSWLFSIATRKALDFFRRQRTHQSSWESLGEEITDAKAEALVLHVEQDELIGLALKQVAPKPLACLLLQIEGFSHAEIAGLVGLGAKSVGTYVSMAREQFRQVYHQINYAHPDLQEVPVVEV